MRDDLISDNYNQITMLTKRFQYMLTKNTLTTDRQYSDNKAHYVFKVWSARHRKMRSHLNRIMHITHRSFYKSAIMSIKESASNNYKYNFVRNKLIEAFKNYSKRELSNLFITWNRNAIKTTKIILQETLGDRDETINDM